MTAVTGLSGDVGTGVLLAGSGLGLGADGRAALGQALDGALAPLRGEAPDLLLLFASPAYGETSAELLVLERDFPGIPIMGGLATGDPGVRETFLFCDERVVSEGAVVVGLGGAACLRPVVSQGCEPIGEPWTITDAERNIVKSIGGRPAYQVLVDTVQRLDRDKQQRVSGNLLVGLAMDEYRDEFKRGDFLIRNLMGVDQSS